MKKKKILEKIKSQYILEKIFGYIKDDKFKMKIFSYSKSFQKKFNLNILDYQVAYILEKDINCYDYLKYTKITDNNFDKELLTKNLKEDLSKYNIDLNIIPKLAACFFKKKKKENKNYKKNNFDNNNYDNINVEIDIYSPFFESLINNKEIFTNFSIIIHSDYFKKFNLMNDYLSLLNKINKSKSQYNSITIYTNNNEELIDLKKIGINFNQITNLAIIIDDKSNFSYEIFFDYLISLNVQNNLSYLFLKKENCEETDPDAFEKLNNFINIEHLSLMGIKFKHYFKLKLSNLKILSLYKCENIFFDKILCLNLEKLYLFNTNIKYSSFWKVKFPKVEECELIDKYSEITHYNSFIDFSGFENLKNLKIEDCDFLLLNNLSIENLTVYRHSFLKRSFIFMLDTSDKKIIEKIISLKTLKRVKFYLNNIKQNVLEIQDKNTSIKEMEINLFNHPNDFIINLQKKFPNLTRLSLLNDDGYSKDSIQELEINENEHYQINNIKLKLSSSSNIILNCGPFRNLVKINIECFNKIKNIKKILPIFDNECNITFKYLTHFRFIYHPEEGIKSDILNNLYNNIDKLTCLKIFIFACSTLKDSEDFYNKFHLKLTSKNMDYFSLYTIIGNEKPDNEKNLDYI